MKISVIYIIKSKIKPERFYIGSAVNFCERLRGHKKSLSINSHGNYYLQKHFNKYGKDDLSFEILERVYDKNLLIKREQYYIDLMQPTFNICKIAGSSLGVKRTDEVKRKLSLIKTGTKRSEETKIKIGNYNRGKKASEETKLKMSAWQYGNKKRNSIIKGLETKKLNPYIISEETKKKISDKLKGTRHSEESIKRGAIKRTGVKINLSEESRQKLIERNKKGVSLAARAKISKSLTGKKQSPETIAKRKAKCVGRKRTPEQRKRMSDAMKGKKKTKKFNFNNQIKLIA